MATSMNPKADASKSQSGLGSSSTNKMSGKQAMEKVKGTLGNNSQQRFAPLPFNVTALGLNSTIPPAPSIASTKKSSGKVDMSLK